MANHQVNITENGTTTLATAGKYCDRNIDINVDCPVGDTSVEDSLVTSAMSGEYRNDRIDTVGYYGFSGKKSVTKITLPNVTSAGSNAFYACSNLVELDMPKLKTIGASCFYGCDALPNFESDTVESVGDSAFQTTKITSVNLPNAKTIGSSAFRQCSLLTTWTADSVTSIGGSCFRDCPKLANVTIPKGITSIPGTAFYNCDSLARIDLPENVRSIIGNAFQQCGALATFIVRKSDGVCALGAALTGTPIASGEGYIYVPSALVDSYKAATNWSTYANQFRAIEDYPEICGG